MKFPAKGGADFAPVPEGTHTAILNTIADMGLQPGSVKFPKPKHKVYLRFELPAERIKYTKDGAEIDGPMSIGQTFTASMNSKGNLRGFIEALRGRPFATDEEASNCELSAALGRACLINVSHRVDAQGRTRSQLESAVALPKGMPAPGKAENPLMLFDLDAPDAAVFERLPSWLRERIQGRITADSPIASPREPGSDDGDPGFDLADDKLTRTKKPRADDPFNDDIGSTMTLVARHANPH